MIDQLKLIEPFFEDVLVWRKGSKVTPTSLLTLLDPQERAVISINPDFMRGNAFRNVYNRSTQVIYALNVTDRMRAIVFDIDSIPPETPDQKVVALLTKIFKNIRYIVRTPGGGAHVIFTFKTPRYINMKYLYEHPSDNPKVDYHKINSLDKFFFGLSYWINFIKENLPNLLDKHSLNFKTQSTTIKIGPVVKEITIPVLSRADFRFPFTWNAKRKDFSRIIYYNPNAYLKTHQIEKRVGYVPVSYTHLTLPTKA